jgi:hypothetical protein
MGKDKSKLKVKKWKKDHLSKGGQKASRSSCTHLTKATFKSKLVIKDKEGNFELVKEKIHQEDTIIVNIYAPKANTFNSIKYWI